MLHGEYTDRRAELRARALRQIAADCDAEAVALELEAERESGRLPTALASAESLARWAADLRARAAKARERSRAALRESRYWAERCRRAIPTKNRSGRPYFLRCFRCAGCDRWRSRTRAGDRPAVIR